MKTSFNNAFKLISKHFLDVIYSLLNAFLLIALWFIICNIFSV